MEKPISFSVPGALQILVERQKGVFEQISNIDGLRIDPEEKKLHYSFFNGKTWEKAVISDATLTAVRSIRDSRNFFNSYTIEYFYLPAEKGLQPVGVKIASEKDSGQYFEIHYSAGQVSGDGILSEKHYFNAGIKTLQDVVKICKDELEHKAETEGVVIDVLLSTIDSITLFDCGV